MKLIKLTQGKFAQVDDEDYEYLNQWKWHVCGKYAGRTLTYKGKQSALLMHRLLLNITNSKLEGDHIDHNRFNNQKNNLRAVTRSQNMQNSSASGISKYLGVSILNSRHYIYWRARIMINNKSIYLGCFKTEIEAAKKYDEAAKKYFGEFANLNFNNDTKK